MTATASSQLPAFEDFCEDSSEPALAPLPSELIIDRAEPTLDNIDLAERERAVVRTTELWAVYRRRISHELKRGPRANDDRMMSPANIRAATHLDGKNQYLKPPEQRALAIAAKLGDRRALEMLLMANQHAAISQAKRVKHKDDSLHDMVNSANAGLLRALQLFQPENAKNACFMTFATWHAWQQAMRDGQLSGRTGLKVPPYMDQYVDLVRKARLQLQQSERRAEHDLDELLVMVNEGRSKKNLISGSELKRAVALLEISYQSIDSNWDSQEDGGRGLADRIGAEETDDLIERMDQDALLSKIQVWMKRKLGDDYDLYVRNQGLFGHNAVTVKELADEAGRPHHQIAKKVRDAKKLVENQLNETSLSLV